MANDFDEPPFHVETVHGDDAKAALLPGKNRNSLLRKMKQFGLGMTRAQVREAVEMEILAGRPLQFLSPAEKLEIANQVNGRYPFVGVTNVRELERLFEESNSMDKDRGRAPSRPSTADSVRRLNERRKNAGGEYIGATLRPLAGAALRALMESGEFPSKVAAVEAALINEEKRLRRRLKKDGPQND